MTAGSRPWLLSLGLHALAVTVALGLVLAAGPQTPPAFRMHLIASPGKEKGTKAATSGAAPSRPHPKAAEPPLPAWREAPASAAEPPSAPVPVSLDELLGAAASAPEAAAPVPSGGWSSAGGEGYTPPPLPPPTLAPPQGARWSLVLSVPGGGGFATHFDGLDSGHPELDRWLEAYLRTVSFPSSLDGRDYQLKWNLRLLDTGRPR